MTIIIIILQEWQALVSFACATLGQTLLASILEKVHLLSQEELSEHGTSERQNTDQATPSSSASGEIENVSLNNMCAESVEHLLQKLWTYHCSDDGGRQEKRGQQLKLERTSSLPPLSNKRLATKQPVTGQHSSPAVDSTNSSLKPPENGLSRSHGESDFKHVAVAATRSLQVSGCERDELFYETCNAEADLNLRQRPRRAKKCSRCSESRYQFSHSKKKRGRSRSDGNRDQQSGGIFVDTSLDDDCPGVPENRVRRPRNQHHHYVCKECLLGGGGGGLEEGDVGLCRGRGGGRRRSGKHSSPPDADHCHTKGIPSASPPGGITLEMSLSDARAAALLLQRTMEFAELEMGDEIAISREEQLHLCSSPQQQDGSNSKPTAAPDGVGVIDIYDPPYPKSVDGLLGERGPSWKELPPLPNPTARPDSPATDMAVVCLDMNSEKMLRPLNQVSGSSLSWEQSEVMRHLHLHDHHHYHHVIHHHSQP